MTFHSNTKDSIISIAIENALKSEMPQRHGSVLTRNAKILACGTNSSRSLINGQCVSSCHAEIDVMYKYFRHNPIKMSKHDLWVIRIGFEDGKLVLRDSKPCKSCVAALHKYRVRKVYYSTANGEIVCVKGKDITNEHVTHWSKNHGVHLQWNLNH